METNNCEIEIDTSPFVRIKDIKILLPILKARLPRSSNVHNMAIMYPKFFTEMKFYTLDGDVTLSSWVIVTYDREDYGKEFNISAPLEPILSSEVKNAFTNSNLFDWNKLYSFTEIDRSISSMIFEISALVKGNPTKFTPCHLYYLDREEALDLYNLSENTELEIKSLKIDLKTGTKFMYDTCLYKTDGSMEYIENLIDKCPSSGVFKNGQLISGAITTGNGLMGFLYTLEDFRNKKYGKLSMEFLMKEQANEGFTPCSAVEIKNIISNEFHLKIGMKFSHIVDFMISRGKA